MRKLKEIVHNLLDVPFSLGAVIAVHLSFPIISFMLFEEVKADIISQNIYGVLAFSMVFWLLPIATVLGVGLRSKYTIIIFMTSALANITYSYAYLPWNTQSPSYEFLRWFMMGIIIVGGAIILRIDHLIPLLAAEKRKFRHSPRTRIEKLIKLQIGEGTPDTALLKNISEGGFSISWLRCAEHEITPTDEIIKFSIKINDQTYQLSGHIAWQTSQGDQNLIGFIVAASDDMSRLFYQCHQHHHSHGAFEMIYNAYRSSGMRKLLISLWAISTTLSVIIPSCGRVSKHKEDSLVTTRLSFPQTSFGLSGSLESSYISISDCSSGYESSFNSISSPFVDLTIGDVGCRAALDSFTHEGKTFLPSPGYTFDTNEGHLTPFQDDSGSIVHVLVTKQIPQIIEGPTSFSFTMIDSAMGNALVYEGTSLPTVTMSIDRSSVQEGSDTTLNVTVTRTPPYDNRLLVNLIHSGTAQQPNDFSGFVNSTYIEEGLDSTSFQVSIVDDVVGEEPENLIALVGTGPAYLASSDNHVVTFNDDDTIALPSNPTIHLNQNSHVTSNGFISQWTDNGINGLHATQTSEPLRPEAQGGFFNTNGVKFDGIDDLLLVPNSNLINLSTINDLTIALSMKTGTDVTTPQAIWEQGGSSKGFLLIIDDGKIYGSAHSASWSSQVSSEIPSNTFMNIKFVYSHTASKVELYINGVLIDSNDTTISMGSHSGGCGLGGVNGKTLWQNVSLTDAPFSGQIGEFIFFNRNLSSEEQDQVNSYFYSEFPPDTSPSIGISSISSSIEENGTSAIVTVERNLVAASNAASYQLSFEGSATMGSDFEHLPNSLSFLPGELIKNFSIVPMNDSEEEALEKIKISLDPIEGYTIIPGSVELDLIDDDLYALPTNDLIMDFDSQHNVTLVGNYVSLWENKVPGGLDWAQNTGSRQPLFSGPQGLNEVVFDGIDDQFQTLTDNLINKSTFTEKTILLVIRTPSDTISNQSIYGQGGGTRGLNIHIANHQIHFVGWNTKDDDSGATTPWGPLSVSEDITGDDLIYILAEYEYSDSGQQELRIGINGQPPNIISGTGKLFSHSGGGLGLLNTKFKYAASESPQMYSGSILKMAYYNRILSDQEKSQLTTHLDSQYR